MPMHYPSSVRKIHRSRSHPKMKYPEPTYLGSSGQDEGFHESYKIGNDEIEIYPPSRDPLEGYRLPWRVVYNGAIDFEGNKKDLLKRYPEFRKVK